ncbi:bifunctional folylpolyglutamate synthase/dihydrofolate synthase [Arenibaculum pallidiluteum]|uniref:bifunctional folylpolyglutamate synthase/dihydrofolate synthase n=1 Tax=Arenibaculum pallidiluteum TaxID=2812559 RepID=UPI002E2842C5|nr:folylpolyglutamate synthase/dihydrofolate synthase family protein [Arenibaculum pallidiluteum]
MSPPANPPSAERAGPVLERLKRLHPRVIDLSLGRVERLMARLGDPQRRLPPVVHVAGTNGKGSTIAFLRAMLEAAGRRVHVYTSPHLVRFHERIRLAGRPIEDDHLADLLEEVERTNAGDPVTFFESTTAAALLAFAREPADALLLEVGLGGRLDATNLVARPAVTVITPVSMDHMDYLGDTLAAIAGEKAGILKTGVPAVIGPQEAAAEAVIRARAEALSTPLDLHGRDWHVAPEAAGFTLQAGGTAAWYPSPVLPGPHQAVNAATAIRCLAAASGLAVPPKAIEEGLRQAVWPGRLQRLSEGRLAEAAAGQDLWLDAAHNPGGARALAAVLAGWGDRPLHLVFGMLSDRDPAEFLRLLESRFSSATAVPIPGEPRALPPEACAAAAATVGIAMDTAADLSAALEGAAGRERGRVLVTGSLALVAEALRVNGLAVP